MSNIIHNYQFLYKVNIIFIFHLINVHEKKMPHNHRTVQHLMMYEIVSGSGAAVFHCTVHPEFITQPEEQAPDQRGDPR